MPPTQGDTIFVSQRNELSGETTVSPALVTHVYTEDDGSKQWWDAAGDKDIVDAVVFARGGTPVNVTVGKAETVQDDDGNDYHIGYATSPDGFDNAGSADDGPALDSATVLTGPVQTPPSGPESPSSPANGGEQTDTVGDGTQPQGVSTDTTGQQV